MNKKEMAEFLADFVVFNAWQKDRGDYKFVLKNAMLYLEETKWKVFEK
jgi:hypothetical protein